MSDRLPTIYHGFPKADADTAIVEEANQDIIARLNRLPSHLVPRVVCSILTSVCCAQDDPGLVFQTIGMNVSRAINAIVAEPEGSA